VVQSRIQEVPGGKTSWEYTIMYIGHAVLLLLVESVHVGKGGNNNEVSLTDL